MRVLVLLSGCGTGTFATPKSWTHPDQPFPPSPFRAYFLHELWLLIITSTQVKKPKLVQQDRRLHPFVCVYHNGLFRVFDFRSAVVRTRLKTR